MTVLESHRYLAKDEIAGPASELDKLQAIRWDMISIKDETGGIIEFDRMERVGPNKLTLVSYVDISGELEQVVGG